MIVRNERESKTNRKEKEDGDHCLRRELSWLPSASSAARRLLLLAVIGYWG
jgi:hypothetical protein